MIPDKTIVAIPVIPAEGIAEFDMKDLENIIFPLEKDRYWFTKHFYKCLPLALGNIQGFGFSCPFGFDVIWNGGESTEDLQIFFHENYSNFLDKNSVFVASEFGHGIITIHFPFILKTPKEVNLMTIAPPNFPIPGLSPMTGVVETDNLRFTFTLNIKVDLPNVLIKIHENTPLMGIIPIPRNFCDSFQIKNAYEILDKNYIDEERDVVKRHGEYRNKTSLDQDGLYYKGMDFDKNKFQSHQLPHKRKEELK